MAQPLKIAFPKKGEPRKDFAAALEKAGYKLDNITRQGRTGYGCIRTIDNEEPLFDGELQRSVDAMRNLSDGMIDAAFVVRDARREFLASTEGKQARIKAEVAAVFAVSECKLMIATKPESNISTLQDLAGKTLATSYPNLLREQLETHNIDPSTVKILQRDGGIERYVADGYVDACLDVTRTGSTLRQYGLQQKFELLQSSVQLVVAQGKRAQLDQRLVQLCTDMGADMSEQTLRLAV